MTRHMLIVAVLDAAAVLFLLVFVGCWVRYAVRELLARRAMRLNQARQPRQAGEQPLVEFTAGPEGNGLVWHDRVLVEVVAEFERDLGMGGVR